MNEAFYALVTRTKAPNSVDVDYFAFDHITH
jgi:hypothetical protein